MIETDSSNRYADENRRAKAAKLIAETDRQAREHGMDPNEPWTAALIAREFVAKLTDEGWADLARRAGCNPPNTSKLLVAQEYVLRSLASVIPGSAADAPEIGERPEPHGENRIEQ